MRLLDGDVSKLARVESHYHRMLYGEILKQGCTIDDAEWHSFTVHIYHTVRPVESLTGLTSNPVHTLFKFNRCETRRRTTHTKRSFSITTRKKKKPLNRSSLKSTASHSRSIHSSEFRDFLLKPELLRAIVDSDKEGVCISLA
ncbi:hypothetical protein OROHE_023443 [Orobanche hederae]